MENSKEEITGNDPMNHRTPPLNGTSKNVEEKAQTKIEVKLPKIHVHTRGDVAIVVSVYRFEKIYAQHIQDETWPNVFLNNVHQDAQVWTAERRAKQPKETWTNFKKTFLDKFCTFMWKASLRQDISKSLQREKTVIDYWEERIELINALEITQPEERISNLQSSCRVCTKRTAKSCQKAQRWSLRR